MTSPLPQRRTEDLLIGRVSIPNATYFLTLCEAKRRPYLTWPAITQRLHAVLGDLHASADFSLVATAVMPDHIHVLGVLGQRLPLSRVMGKNR